MTEAASGPAHASAAHPHGPDRIRVLGALTALLFVASLLGAVVVARDDTPGGALDVRAAAAATRKAGSGRLAMTMTFRVGGRSVEATGEGSFTTDPPRSTLTMQSSVLPQPMELVADGTTAYMRAVGPYATEAQGKPWVAFDAGGFRPPLSLDPTSADPFQALALLEDHGGVRNVRRDGTDEVRGVPVTRYTADVDLADLLAGTDRRAAKGLAGTLDGMESELTLSIDDEGLVRRSTMHVRGDIGQPLDVTVTTEFFDFGAPVAIAVPPPDQVTRVTSPLPTG